VGERKALAELVRGIEPRESCDVSGTAGCPVANVEEVEMER